MSVFKAATWNKSPSSRDELNSPAEHALAEPSGPLMGASGRRNVPL